MSGEIILSKYIYIESLRHEYTAAFFFPRAVVGVPVTSTGPTVDTTGMYWLPSTGPTVDTSAMYWLPVPAHC